MIRARASTSDHRAAGARPRRVIRFAGSLRGTARRVASDRNVHAEMQRAIADASRAARRARRIGPTRTLRDKRLARQLRRATRHASRAASLARYPRRTRARRAALMLVGSGAVAGAAYGGWRKYAQPPPEQPV